MSKIIITGTGRCGTTFLIKLFSFLGYDTGYTRENYKANIFENCNSGMEREYNENYSILKNPDFMEKWDKIIKDINIKLVIIPIRDYKESALSRESHKFDAGGLWNAGNMKEQLIYYNKLMADYIFYMAKYDIPTFFLDFNKMVNDKKYLFDKLNEIWLEKDISFDLFSSVYDEVSETSKPSEPSKPSEMITKQLIPNQLIFQ